MCQDDIIVGLVKRNHPEGGKKGLFLLRLEEYRRNYLKIPQSFDTNSCPKELLSLT